MWAERKEPGGPFGRPVCFGLQRVKHGPKAFILPQSSLPGAAPAIEPTGRGQRQNTRAAQAERAARAAEKRAALKAKQAEAEAERGKPRKQRADKGTKRGPHKKA